jgi:hypothetical protein
LSEDGALHREKATRHSSTHRFTVLHDIDCKPSRNSIYVEHSDVEEFVSLLIRSLQLARAAILYFVDMIAINEAKTSVGRGLVMRWTMIPDLPIPVTTTRPNLRSAASGGS